MKRLQTLLMILCLVIVSVSVQAAAIDSTFNVASHPDEGATYVRYAGTVDMSADSVGTYFTQALFIGDANQGTAVLRAVCSNVTGTEDVTVYAQFSMDRKNWDDAGAIKTSLGTSFAYTDSVGKAQSTWYKGDLWVRFRIVGNTGNAPTTVSWDLFVPKTTGAPPRGDGITKNSK